MKMLAQTKQSIKDEILDFAARHPHPAERATLGPKLSWGTGTVVALLIALLLVPVGVIQAQNSLPGEALYPLKKISEQVQLITARGSEQKAVLQESHSLRRMQELQQTIHAGDVRKQQQAVAEVQKTVEKIVREPPPEPDQQQELLDKLCEEIERIPAQMAALEVQEKLGEVRRVLEEGHENHDEPTPAEPDEEPDEEVELELVPTSMSTPALTSTPTPSPTPTPVLVTANSVVSTPVLSSPTSIPTPTPSTVSTQEPASSLLPLTPLGEGAPLEISPSPTSPSATPTARFDEASARRAGQSPTPSPRRSPAPRDEGGLTPEPVISAALSESEPLEDQTNGELEDLIEKLCAFLATRERRPPACQSVAPKLSTSP